MTAVWHIREVSKRTAALDFRDAGTGRGEYTQVWADDVRLCNAVELVQGGQPELQIIVCEHCGITHCEPGGWVAPRWTGSAVVLLPAFRLLAEEMKDGGGGTEYAPPGYLQSEGIPLFSADVAEVLPLHRDPRVLPLVSGAELVQWTQWSAPCRALGRFPDAPVVRADACVAASDGPVAGASDAVTKALAECGPMDHYTLRSIGPTENGAHVLPRCREWTPIVRGAGADLLCPVPGLVAEKAAGRD